MVLKNKEYDLTDGPIFRSITFFAVPMLLGNLLQQLYNIVDTWVVGQWIGTQALASVGAVFALMVFLTSVLLGLCMGCGAVFSQCFGKGEKEILIRRIRTSFCGIAMVTVVITAVSLAGCDLMIRWMQIPEELREMTRAYLRIVLLGIPGIFLYNFFAGYLKSIGNSVVPLLFLGISTLTNIVLDLLFVLVFSLGIAGAATATVTAQYLSGLLTAGYCLRKDDRIRSAFSHLRIYREDMKILASYSIYTCLQQSVMNLGILMVQGIVNGFGTQVMAAFAAGVKIDAFAYMPAQEYGNAFSTYLAQNYGAGRKDRILKGIRIGVTTTTIYCLLVSLILYLFAGRLMGIFVDASEVEVIAIGVGYLHIEGLFYVGIGILFLWYGFYRALGRPQMSLVLTFISLGTRVLLAKIASMTAIGYTGIWWAIPIGWALADLTGFVYYMKCFKGDNRRWI